MAQTTAFVDLSNACRDTATAISASIVQVLGRPRRPASGVVVRPERVLTTSHSVEWEEELRVRVSAGEVFPAQVAGRDPGTDLVLLRVPGLPSPAARLAGATADTGTLALIAGRSWSNHLRARLTTVSRVGPIRVGSARPLQDVLALDAHPYPGFSGSAVVLPDGSVAGLATAGIVRGNALAVPAPLVAETVDVLEQHGGIRRGFLGVTTQPVHIPEAQRGGAGEDGLLILGLASGAPAAAAGILVGDILVAIDGHAVADPEQLLMHLSGDRIGKTATVNLIRGTELLEVTVTIGERPSRR